MKTLKQNLKDLWNDESAQGMAEYALLLVAIIAVAVIFRKQITEAVQGKMGQVSEKIMSFE